MKGYSLYELIVTIIVIATLATLSMRHYGVQREKSFDTEAQTNLAMILAAERDYRRQLGAYYVSGNEALLNSNLAGVLLPTAAVANRPWNYLTSAGVNICCAQATRTVAPVRTWRLCCNEREPILGTCGAGAVNCPGGPCI